MADAALLKAETDRFRNDLTLIRREVGKVMVGQESVIEATLTALCCGPVWTC